MSAVLRTHTIDERQGFMKALVAARDDRILGFTMIGAEAGEAVAAVPMTMLAGLPHTALRDAVLAHPTMAEGPALFSRMCRRGSSHSGAPRSGIPLKFEALPGNRPGAAVARKVGLCALPIG
jgi:Pyridine nucleotide-disulphide oxidoreductase, dimerisation domain